MADTIDLRDGAAPLAPALPAAAAPPQGREAAQPGSGLEPTLYRFILRHSMQRQLLVLAVTLASFPFLLLRARPAEDDRQPGDRREALPAGIPRVRVRPDPLPLVLCAIFLALVFINGGFKYLINVLKGQLGERHAAAAALRALLPDAALPARPFRKVSPAEMIPMVTAEVESLGGFIGDAIVAARVPGRRSWYSSASCSCRTGCSGRRDRALSDPGLRHPEAAAQDQPARQGRASARSARSPTGSARSASGIAEIHANDAARWQLADHRRASSARSTTSASRSSAASSSSSSSTTSSTS